ncbi:DUF5937 family protein [Streptomyces albiaxialis]|uniref:DUF5937 family protein n=1 Tax=Streptomyces albiaxialis TaxID=329523 RepID=A0ABN2W4C5_9ACTN
MIELRLGAADLCRTRFGFSPLSEVAASLHMLSAGLVHPLHRPWSGGMRRAFAEADVELLKAVVPARRDLADFLFAGVRGRTTTIEGQLDVVRAMSPEAVRTDFAKVWEGGPLPPVLERALDEGAAGVHRLADALRGYWEAVIAPHWPRLRTVLEADVSHRARLLVEGGAEALMADLHPEVALSGGVLSIDKPHCDPAARDLTGQGLLLVPSVYVWPHLIVIGEVTEHQPTLVYAVRGIAHVWQDGAPREAEDDALAALLGRTRAALLRRLGAPLSPTALAGLLGQSPSSACQHLAVLRRSGLVRSWRQGREVLYERTALATALLAAGSEAACAPTPLRRGRPD